MASLYVLTSNAHWFREHVATVMRWPILRVRQAGFTVRKGLREAATSESLGRMR